MGRLTTHVLDTSHGRPAAGMALTLYRVEGESHVYQSQARTNDDGRCDQPLLEGAEFLPGSYEIRFEVGDYFAALGVGAAGAFLDIVPIRFVISDRDAHYHVPLLVSPYSFSTYRGS